MPSATNIFWFLFSMLITFLILDAVFYGIEYHKAENVAQTLIQDGEMAGGFEYTYNEEVTDLEPTIVRLMSENKLYNLDVDYTTGRVNKGDELYISLHGEYIPVISKLLMLDTTFPINITKYGKSDVFFK